MTCDRCTHVKMALFAQLFNSDKGPPLTPPTTKSNLFSVLPRVGFFLFHPNQMPPPSPKIVVVSVRARARAPLSECCGERYGEGGCVVKMQAV